MELGDNIRYYIWDKPQIHLKYDLLITYGTGVKINIDSVSNDVLLMVDLLFKQITGKDDW